MRNEWKKTELVPVEFEKMMRRRLSSGAAPVTACAGFDLNSASAYLEGALKGAFRANFESHLAGCVGCRRNLIELARLAQSAPILEAAPARTFGLIHVLDSWKQSLNAWFDLSSNAIRWKIASATVATLILTFIAQSWRHGFYRTHQPQSVDLSARVSSDSKTEVPQSPISQSIQTSRSSSAELERIPEVSLARSTRTNEIRQVPMPAPDVGPKMADRLNVKVEASTEQLALKSTQPGEAPAAPAASAPPAPAASKPTEVAGARLTATAERYLRSSPETPIETLNLSSSSIKPYEERTSNIQATGDPVRGPRISPPGLFNPMIPVGNSFVGSGRPFIDNQLAPRPLSNFGKVLPRLRPLYWAESIMRSINPWSKSDSESETEKKSGSNLQETADKGDSKQLVVRISDKIFHYDKGVLIDQEYRPDMAKWNRWTLTPGSKEYNEILAKIPALKLFFDHGPIIVVWKNGIYTIPK